LAAGSRKKMLMTQIFVHVLFYTFLLALGLSVVRYLEFGSHYPDGLVAEVSS
jgi:hypothetical protein